MVGWAPWNAVAEQNDGRARAGAKSEQRAEIGVGGDQHSILIDCGPKDDVVRGVLELKAPNMQGVVPGSCEVRSDLGG